MNYKACVATSVCMIFMTPLIADEETEKIFTNLYELGAWGLNEEGVGSSGIDSRLENSWEYIKFLQQFLKTHKIQSVVDVGCGDWSFSKAINWENINYTGVDIVKSVIERNQKMFSAPNVSFIQGDMNEVELPVADLLICKDVLQYLPKNKIDIFLQRANQFKYCLFINDVDRDTFSSKNKSIATGDHRNLDLTKSPFNINAIKVDTLHAGNSVKQVLLKTPDTDLQRKEDASKKCFVINQIHSYQGFFSIFMTIINYLDLYDKNDIDGLLVDFKGYGLFYEAAYGPNSWEYYFEPIKLGVTSGTSVDFDYSVNIETGRIAYLAEIGLSRQRVSELVQKYICVKPAILEEVEQFAADYFQGKFVIGVHYRGTDKSPEAGRVCYEDMETAILHFITQKSLTDFAIYIATDEENFLDYMQKKFEGKIISQNCLRSSDQSSPIHYFNAKNTSPYRTGKEALIDSILLSKCGQLIRTSSCLSLVSTFFNPEIPVIELSKRKVHCYGRF
jgi:SAM-dependent methyltransferase